MSSTYLRPAIAADIDAVAGLEASCFAEPWSVLVFEQFVGAAGFLVAIESTASPPEPGGPLDGHLLGYTVTTVASTRPRSEVHVRNLAVAPAARRRGLGSRLLDTAIERYRQSGYEQARLEVRASNTGAVELYRTFGFEVVAHQPGYYGDGEAAIVMAARLDA